MIERLRVRILAGAAGEFSSPEWILCADSYSVSIPLLNPPPMLPQCHIKIPVILPKVQVAGYTKTCIHLWPNEVQCCPGIAWEPIRKGAHTQLIREHSVTVISAHLATVDWFWPKEWNYCVQANLPPKKKYLKKSAGGEWLATRRKSHHHHSILSSSLMIADWSSDVRSPILGAWL